ncbi:MAG TPA: oligopeptidase A [Gammaproteobacteria bacterium]|nr:oligopeptidase A [Gammaproteobacteria bacterium]
MKSSTSIFLTGKTMQDNPLLENNLLPAFSRIKPEHIEPAIDYLLADNRQQIRELLKQGNYSWDNTLQPLEDLDDRLNRAWSPASHLHSVADNEALRKAYNNCLDKLSEYATDMGQNAELYHAWLAVTESAEYDSLSRVQRKIIEHALRDFRLSGIDLKEEDKKTFKQIQQKLSRLQTRFEENLLDATQVWKKHVTDKKILSGLPDSALSLARQVAGREGVEGWIFTLEFPSYYPLMQYADNASLRREMYTAYVTRASDTGPDAGKWDNSAIMQEILALRYQLAQLLGYESFAHYSLARKMARTPEEVLGFLNDLADRSRPAAGAEFCELQEFALDHFGVDSLNAWDVAYYSEKLRKHKFDLSQEELRPYFPVPQVLRGLFAVVNQLYGLTILPRENVDTWHPDVCFYDIYDDNNELRGCFYLDLYARPNKRGGAWMDECVVRKKTINGIQTPVAYLTCNFTPPIDDQPSLLTHDEVTTLFHEFGHGLHHMLTRVDYAAVAGINGVPWDAVELPSQFMENWCWEKASLDLISGHYQTGERISQALFDRLHASKNFQTAMQMVRQLEFSLFDFRLHHEYSDSNPVDIQQLIDEVRRQVAVVIPPDFNRFQHSFSHIFAGGYAAGYYSYKWAEVLSADAFSRFEETGIFDGDTGRAFLHTVLEQGGSRDPMELFVEFRGREPSIEPLLRHSGITS